MKNNKRNLGRGLFALIPQGQDYIEDIQSVDIENKIYNLKITDIVPNSDQPRKIFDDASLDALADSIKENGLVQPIIVNKKEDHYVIIAGERRWRASRKAGFKTIPAIIRSLDDEQTLQQALVENLLREDLNAIEEALAYQSLQREFNKKQEDLARITGKSRSAIANILRLLQLPKIIQQRVKENRLSAGHARFLLNLQNSDEMVLFADKVEENDWSVRSLQKEISKYQKNNQKKSDKVQDTAEIYSELLSLALKEVEDHFTYKLGKKVSIQMGAKENKIQISYHDNDELQEILLLLDPEYKNG